MPKDECQYCRHSSFFFFPDKKVAHFGAGAIVKNHQVEWQTCIPSHGFQADFQDIQRLGVESAQEGNVIQQRNRDPFGAGDIFDKFRGVLTFTHLRFSLFGNRYSIIVF